MMRKSSPHTIVRLCLAAQMAVLGPAAPLYAAPKPATDDATAIHVLNRLTFGANPTDLAKIRETGVKAWIEAQLQPAKAADKALDERLSSLPTLAMNTGELREKYEIPPNVRQQIQKARAEMQAASEKDGKEAAPQAPGDEKRLNPADRRALMEKFPELAKLDGRPARVIEELQTGKVIRAAFAERQLDEVMADFWFNHFNVYARKGPIEFMVSDYERTIRDHAWGKFEDLLVATAKSPAMLFYLDNWQSVDPDFSPRDLRRPPQGQQDPRQMERAARDPRAQQRLQERQQARRDQREQEGEMQKDAAKRPPRRSAGINENYARELMELHTLGVDGGYTQKDVVEVAKAFTGWTILGEGPGGPRRNRESVFGFVNAAHVKGDKTVLGVTIKEGGEKEGMEILHILATSPATAKFVSRKLVERFVADNPPQELVDRATKTFLKSGGDIREVVRTVVTSDEFLGPKYRQAKVKTPLEFVVSSIRASEAEVTNAQNLAGRIGAMGMPLYMQQPPTGYKDTAEEWISTSALLERMNFALDLSSGRIRGVKVAKAAPDAGSATLDTVAARILPLGLSSKSHETLAAEAEKDGNNPVKLVGLVLGSPEFQRR